MSSSMASTDDCPEIMVKQENDLDNDYFGIDYMASALPPLLPLTTTTLESASDIERQFGEIKHEEPIDIKMEQELSLAYDTQSGIDPLSTMAVGNNDVNSLAIAGPNQTEIVERFIIYELETSPNSTGEAAHNGTTISTQPPKILNSKLHKKRREPYILNKLPQKTRIFNTTSSRPIVTTTIPTITSVSEDNTKSLRLTTTSPPPLIKTTPTSTVNTNIAKPSTTQPTSVPMPVLVPLSSSAKLPTSSLATKYNYVNQKLSNDSTLSSKSSDLQEKCFCSLRNPTVDANMPMYSIFNRELKDFFEEMFQETLLLHRDQQRSIKIALMDAISSAEEDVEAGKFCEKCCP